LRKSKIIDRMIANTLSLVAIKEVDEMPSYAVYGETTLRGYWIVEDAENGEEAMDLVNCGQIGELDCVTDISDWRVTGVASVAQAIELNE